MRQAWLGETAVVWGLFGRKKGKATAAQEMPSAGTLMIRSLVAAAAAQGGLSDGEAKMIAIISSRLIGDTVTEARARELYAEITSRKFDFAAELAAFKSVLSRDDAERMVTLTYLMAFADGAPAEGEIGFVAEVAARLGVVPPALGRCLDDGVQIYKELTGRA
jgi:tellurite resistance protein